MRIIAPESFWHPGEKKKIEDCYED